MGLIEKIYAAVNLPELWAEVLAETSRHLGGGSIAFFAGAPNVSTPALMTSVEMDAKVWDSYAEYFAGINPIMQRAEKSLSPTETWFSDRIINDREFERTEFCVDFFEPNEMFYSVGIRLAADNMPPANLSCQRAREAGAFGGHADLVLRTLRPHLQQALLLRKRLSELHSEAAGLRTIVDSYHHAVMGIDAQERVTFASAAAEALLRAGTGVCLRDGRLMCVYPRYDSLLQVMLRGAARLTAAETGATELMLTQSKGEQAMRIPLPDGQEVCVSVTPYRSYDLAPSPGAVALVFLSHTARRSGSRTVVLKALYGLTPTELRVAECLVDGLDAAELAVKLRLTRETVRYYVKQILQKTNTRRQQDCIRLILSLPSM